MGQVLAKYLCLPNYPYYQHIQMNLQFHSLHRLADDLQL